MRTRLAALAFGLSGLAGVALVDPATAVSGDGTACRKIEDACKAAGFVKGEHAQGKGLGQDCAKPIMNGQTVSGVTVDAATVKDCKAERAAAKSKHSK
jgi:hypothetical protein